MVARKIVAKTNTLTLKLETLPTAALHAKDTPPRNGVDPPAGDPPEPSPNEPPIDTFRTTVRTTNKTPPKCYKGAGAVIASNSIVSVK